MKPLLRSALVILLVAVFYEPAFLFAQTGSLTDEAKKVWQQNNPHFPLPDNFQFDRISRQGQLVVFETFHPASFLIMAQTPDGFTVAAYSYKNLFFSNDPSETGQPELLNALSIAVKKDPGRMKSTWSVPGSVGPLIHTRWGQGRLFNYYCPRDPRGPNGRTYNGCVAVAMGQIIRYYGRFNSLDTDYSFDSGYYGNLSARIGPYDWQAMEDAPISVDLEVSDFLSDLGILLHMSYGASGSTTNSHRTLEAFHELGYINGIILRKSRFTMESWTEVFYQNLSEYKPILVTGGGHAFVCDGFNQDGLFHFNLGWDGYGDGYYPLSGVMTLPVTEAFTELEPVSWPEPPENIGFLTAGRESFVRWAYSGDQHPLLSRIYVDDDLFKETTDSIVNIKQLSPGIHRVSVSAVYPEGESRWIGPEEVFVKGTPLIIDDPLLYSIFQEYLGHGISDSRELQIYEGDLSLITSLDIDQPVSSMKGLGLCNHLKRLIIHGSPGLTLDAGPLEDLSELRILEWINCIVKNSQTLGKLNQLTELRIRQTYVDSLDFLRNCKKLMKFEYSHSPAIRTDVVSDLPLLEELVLSGVQLVDPGSISGMSQLFRLDLSGNRLTGTGFLSSLSNLDRLDLSGNLINQLLLTDQLQSLRELDVSGNEISSIHITAELKCLKYIDLSDNRLTTPGRLFLYTPALIELDVSNNRLRDLGKQRCPNLEILHANDNQLIIADWVSLQPRLKKIDLEHNRISDLSGLIRNNLFRQLDFLGLDQNPLSKQSFLEYLPILVDAIDSLSKPVEYQPLSPCYLSPADGSRLQGSVLELNWFIENSDQPCTYDLLIVKGDSLVPLLQGLDSPEAVLKKWPAASFSWIIATRTADSVYYSGVNDVASTTELVLPFNEGFETYREDEPLSGQSGFWYMTGDSKDPDHSAMVVSSTSRTGLNALELSDNGTVILSTEHLVVPYICIRFSVLVPEGQRGEFRIQNLNGMYFRLVWNSSDTGTLYVNDKVYNTFMIDHHNWMDYQIMAHARNNSIFVKAGQQLVFNEPWMVPEGVICMESFEFSSLRDQEENDSPENKIYFDDIRITSITGTSGIESEDVRAESLQVYPNPFEDHIYITFPEPGNYDVSVIDITGRVVYRQMLAATSNSNVMVSLAGLPSGIYTLYTGHPDIRPVKIIRSQSGY